MSALTSENLDILKRLAATVQARRGGDPAQSYSAGLIADPKRAAKKLGEEATEVVIAAVGETPGDLAREAADLVYHLIVLLESRGTSLADVLAVLGEREGTSGLAEKAARGQR